MVTRSTKPGEINSQVDFPFALWAINYIRCDQHVRKGDYNPIKTRNGLQEKRRSWATNWIVLTWLLRTVGTNAKQLLWMLHFELKKYRKQRQIKQTNPGPVWTMIRMWWSFCCVTTRWVTDVNCLQHFRLLYRTLTSCMNIFHQVCPGISSVFLTTVFGAI